MSSTCESCGWTAAVVAMLCFGSFGVPIKSETCRRLDIDPLVFQSYKTVVCFLSSAIIIGVTGHPYRFTPWGIVSAVFWVPGGVGTVAAIQLAGLAIAVAVGNSLIALVSFIWGIFIFHEAIHSRMMACVGIAMMILGFTGMSYFSTRSNSKASDHVKPHTGNQPLLVQHHQPPQQQQHEHQSPPSSPGPPAPVSASPLSRSPSSESIELVEEAREQQQLAFKEIHDFEAKTFNNNNNKGSAAQHKNNGELHMDSGREPCAKENCATPGGLRHRQIHVVHHHSNEMVSSSATKHLLLSPTIDAVLPVSSSSISTTPLITMSSQAKDPNPDDTLLIIGDSGWKLTRRQVGLALAVFNGCWGGSVLVPMQFCPDKSITSGIGYVWSFSIGAMLVTGGLWVFRFLWNLAASGSPMEAYQALPPLHLKEMWKPGGLSGLLWSIGNLFSILSVEYLGEGVGYCVVQASMLVSGLFGIFWFHEVKGTATISKWFLSAFVTVSGILLLSYEHHET